ncbi:MAG TPA: peptide MFS transporter, partial [Polyangiaceae bacterium]|nr:peptide MFS transporter [Polyangiaceae bacterium]
RGGLGWSLAQAGSAYGSYAMAAYLANLPGGWVADRWLGPVRSVIAGGALIVLGHVSLALRSMPFFYGGLGLVVVGTGLLKVNCTSLVGSLYAPDDHRRDAGFSIYYMGINLGASLAPLVCGALAVRFGWHAGFGAAGVAMACGLAQFVARRDRFGAAALRATPRGDAAGAGGAAGEGERALARGEGDPAGERRRIVALLWLVVAATLFWAIFDQASTTLTLFAERHTRRVAFGLDFPAGWYQSLNPVLLLALSPVFTALWGWLGPRQPSSPVKFAFGLWGVGLGMALLVPAARLAEAGPVSPWWLAALYLSYTCGELCLSPVGQSAVTRVAPKRMAGLMLGVWFLSIAVGSRISGACAPLFERVPLTTLFSVMAALGLLGGVAMLVAAPALARLMDGERPPALAPGGEALKGLRR